MKKILAILLAVINLSLYAASNDDLENMTSDITVKNKQQPECHSQSVKGKCNTLATSKLCNRHYRRNTYSKERHNCHWIWASSYCAQRSSKCRKMDQYSIVNKETESEDFDE